MKQRPIGRAAKRFVLSLLCGLLSASWARAATLCVWTNSPSPGAPFNAWTNAAHDLQTAVDAARDGDTVWVTNGVYRVGAISNEYGWSRVALTNGVTLQSVNGPEFTSIEGDNVSPARCVYINHTNAALIGFTLANGCANGLDWVNYGGGAFVFNARLVSNCAVTACSATGVGGGMALISAKALITHCTVKQNVASDGAGGIGVYWGGNTIVENCLIESNRAGWGGGGMWVDNCYGGVRNCLIVDNHSYNNGGGVGLSSGNAIFNCAIENNTADGRGDGIWITTGGASIYNCSFYYNGAENLYDSSPPDTIKRTYYCCTTPLTNTVMAHSTITNEPGYVDRTNGDYRLSAASPCRDTGFQYAWMSDGATDLDGHPRVINRRVDVGVYEYWQIDSVRAPAIYYVATNGNDLGTGLSINDPFRTVQRGLDAVSAGDTVCVRGGTYREFLVMPAYGEPSNPVTFCAYSNEMPVIKGSVIATGWVHHVGSIWKLTNWNDNSQQVFDDGCLLQ